MPSDTNTKRAVINERGVMNQYQTIFQQSLDRINTFWKPESSLVSLEPLEAKINEAWLNKKPIPIFKILCNQYILEAKKV